ncbi:hypothetical protein [Peribacillus sp. ACCC06369]|uniref:hypothetical protein n=1 Tax=Peribacillus sp. ACCC06369 TaxID=3055860 RepID=UPI0025A1CDFA|nr:hypothetical protein [Peribacillus sp. ACCC06369]MDM5360757.1 hypothetical protein [Peribacillus sp. ACCC06369]
MEKENLLAVKCSCCKKELDAIDLVIINKSLQLTHIQCPDKGEKAIIDVGYFNAISRKYLTCTREEAPISL